MKRTISIVLAFLAGAAAVAWYFMDKLTEAFSGLS